MPDSPLPPQSLLDQPAHEVEVLSAETLEFTSRLIERKLKAFGCEVKVVAAYPGAHRVSLVRLPWLGGAAGDTVLGLQLDPHDGGERLLVDGHGQSQQQHRSDVRFFAHYALLPIVARAPYCVARVRAMS